MIQCMKVQISRSPRVWVTACVGPLCFELFDITLHVPEALEWSRRCRDGDACRAVGVGTGTLVEPWARGPGYEDACLCREWDHHSRFSSFLLYHMPPQTGLTTTSAHGGSRSGFPGCSGWEFSVEWRLWGHPESEQAALSGWSWAGPWPGALRRSSPCRLPSWPRASQHGGRPPRGDVTSI